MRKHMIRMRFKVEQTTTPRGILAHFLNKAGEFRRRPGWELEARREIDRARLYRTEKLYLGDPTTTAGHGKLIVGNDAHHVLGMTLRLKGTPTLRLP